MFGARHRARKLACITAGLFACGAPSAPEIPPRSEIGPPPEAASPRQCVPPYPMNFGNDWYLLADLDQGEACFAYLERDECVLAIFTDCTDTSEDRRQWRGRVDVDVDGATAELTPVFQPSSNGTRLPRQPVCCQGEVSSTPTTAWSKMRCYTEQCGHTNDLRHVGLYLERHDPQLDPAAAVTALGAAPSSTLKLTQDESTGTIWGVNRNQAFTLDPQTGTSSMRASLSQGRDLVAADGVAYVIDAQGLVVISAQESLTIALPGPARTLHPRALGVLVALDGPSGPLLWSIDAQGATFTSSAAAPQGVRALTGVNPTYITTDDSVIYAMQADLSWAPYYDTAALVLQTGGPLTPLSPTATLDGLAFLGPCHSAARKIHCVFEVSPPDAEPLRRGVAGVDRLQQLIEDKPRDRWITVSDDGRITQLERSTGRPLLQGQVRLNDPPKSALLLPGSSQLLVLHGNDQLSLIDLTRLP